MTLSGANDLVAPILRSELFKTDGELQKKVAEIKELFVGFELTFGLSQFTILDKRKETAFRELIDMYNNKLSRR